jgi:hypothetical protein
MKFCEVSAGKIIEFFKVVVHQFEVPLYQPYDTSKVDAQMEIWKNSDAGEFVLKHTKEPITITYQDMTQYFARQYAIIAMLESKQYLEFLLKFKK